IPRRPVEVHGAAGGHGRGILGRLSAPIVDDVRILVIPHGNKSPIGVLGVLTGNLGHLPGLGIGVEVLVMDAVSCVRPQGSVGEGSRGKATNDSELSSNCHSESKRQCYRRLVVTPVNVPRRAKEYCASFTQGGLWLTRDE